MPTKFFWGCLGVAVIVLMVFFGVRVVFHGVKVNVTFPGGSGRVAGSVELKAQQPPIPTLPAPKDTVNKVK